MSKPVYQIMWFRHLLQFSTGLCVLLMLSNFLISCGRYTTTDYAFMPTKLDVERIAVQNKKILPASHSAVQNNRTLPAFHRAVQDEQAVQQLYKAALDLPKFQGVANCPTSSYQRLEYDLTFSRQGNDGEKMVLDASGCTVLRLSQGDVKWVNQSFIDLFEKTVGISSLTP
jgi:hypothetical protein